MAYGFASEKRYLEWLKDLDREPQSGDLVYYSNYDIAEQLGVVTSNGLLKVVDGDRNGRFHAEKEVIRVWWIGKVHGENDVSKLENGSTLPCEVKETLMDPMALYSWNYTMESLNLTIRTAMAAAAELLENEKFTLWTAKRGFTLAP